MAKKQLNISGLTVLRDDQPTLEKVSLAVGPGELHVLMGPNGSGKSSLALALLGHPSCTIKSGRVSLDGRSLLKLPVNERAALGLHLSPQQPPEVAGVGLANFLRTAVNERRTEPIDALSFQDELLDMLEVVGLPDRFLNRNLNQKFSGGEKKRAEMLQLLLLQPKYAVLDEIDSGLDVDGLKTVAKGIERARQAGTGILLITHSDRMLQSLKPTRVHVLVAGKLVESGGPALAKQIARQGFKKFIKTINS
jgi:Fe-S cluster assembly ATP-binding protein